MHISVDTKLCPWSDWRDKGTAHHFLHKYLSNCCHFLVLHWESLSPFGEKNVLQWAGICFRSWWWAGHWLQSFLLKFPHHIGPWVHLTSLVVNFLQHNSSTNLVAAWVFDTPRCPSWSILWLWEQHTILTFLFAQLASIKSNHLLFSILQLGHSYAGSTGIGIKWSHSLRYSLTGARPASVG